MADYKDLTRQLMIEIESLEEEIRRVHSESKSLDQLIETMENDKRGLYSIDNEGLKTFAYYVATLLSSSNTVASQGLSAVATLIMFLPNFVLFIILQSNVMNTMAHSGIK